MADTDIEVRDDDLTKLPQKALLGEIERTRADLARTIDEIADRVAPANVARRVTDRAKERISQVDPLIAGAVALTVVSASCYLIWRKLKK
jgi:hypothetical protein